MSAKVDTAEKAKERIALLDRKIDDAPGWGAYVAALLEEREALAIRWLLPKRSNITP